MDNRALREEFEAFKQDLLTITDMQLKLKNRADEWEAKIKEAEGRKEKDWPQYDDEYYSLDSNGDVIGSISEEDKWDEARKAIGNCYRTKEEAEFELERLKVIAELKKFARPFVENDMNFILEYHHDASEISLDYFISKQYGEIYFGSELKAKEAIKAVGEDRIKKYYFRVVD